MSIKSSIMAKRGRPTLADIKKKLDAEKLDNIDPVFDDISKDKIIVKLSSDCFNVLETPEKINKKRVICAKYFKIHLTWREVEYRVKNNQCVTWIDDEDIDLVWIFAIGNVDIDTNTVDLDYYGSAK